MNPSTAFHFPEPMLTGFGHTRFGRHDEGLRAKPSCHVENVCATRSGATGVSMHVMASLQLLGRAGALQLPQPELAGVFNMGGMGVSNYVSILERAA